MKNRTLLEHSLVTPLQECYLIAGATCSVSSNSELVLAAARDSFGVPVKARDAMDARMRLWVDASARSERPWPAAHFRGMHHLVFAAFDSDNTVLVDLRGRRAVGRLSPSMAADRGYLRRVVFPTLFGIFTYTIPVTPLHCACLERGGRGLLLSGPSGSGKSTLALALAQQGFGFLSDEWTYFSWREGRLAAWSLPVPLKLLPDACRHFPELATMQPEVSLNGELAYEVDPESLFGVRCSASAVPDWLILLERQDAPGFNLSRVSPAEAAAEFEDDVCFFAAHGFSEGRDLLRKTLQGLGRLSCWRLRYGGGPAEVALRLLEFVEKGARSAPAVDSPKLRISPSLRRPDFLRRLTPTPLVADLCVTGFTVRLETDSAAIFGRTCGALETRGRAPAGQHDFVWRLVAEADSGTEGPLPAPVLFAQEALALAHVGQRTFLAVDQDAREAVGFVEDRFVKDDGVFESLLLTTLMELTARAAHSVPKAQKDRTSAAPWPVSFEE